MGNIAGKFADQDPIILSGLSIAANNNLTAVRATIAETDQLQASSVVFQPTGLLATPASKLPNVATSLQGDISAALSGTGQAGTASEQPGGGGIPCFLAETLVTLWGGKRMRFIELYDLFTHLTPLQSMPRVLAFNEYDRVAGEIVEVMRNIKYEYAVVRFGDKTITEAVAEHRYWTGKEYVSIKNLVGKYIITETGKRTKVKSVTKVSVPEGVYVYNMHVRDYKNYCANRHRVHNLKPESSPGGPGAAVYKETRDDALLHKYWVEERTNTPLWFQNSHDTWGFSWEECKAFHNGCWKIFEFDNVLIYVEKIGDYANIHFSIVRGADAWKLVEEFKALRDELFNDFKMVFGWVNTKNRMLKRLIEDVGFQYEGFEMLNGHTHGQLLKWHCYVAKKQIVIPSVSV